LFLIALFSVFVIESCPTTISKVAGRYFRAETMKFSITVFPKFLTELHKDRQKAFRIKSSGKIKGFEKESLFNTEV
jgi:hypothetical protein